MVAEEAESDEEDGGEEEAEEPAARTRGGCLTAFLGLTLLLSLLAIAADLTMRRGKMMAAPALLPPNVGYLLLAFAHALLFVFVIAIFRWKRWGVYGFFAMHAAGMVLGFWVGDGWLRTLAFGLGPPAVLVYLVRLVGGERFE